MEITEQLTGLMAEVKTFTAKAEADVKALGSVSTETKAALDQLSQKVDAIQSQADAIDLKFNERLFNQRAEEFKSVGEILTTGEKFQVALKEDWAGAKSYSFPLKQSAFPRSEKAIISDISLGAGTAGLIMPTAFSGLAGMPKQELRIRDLMPVQRLTEGHSFSWLKQTVRTNNAAPQQETSPKSESTYDWSTEVSTVQTIAHYVNVTRQALDDVPWLRGEIDRELMYGLKVKEEAEILAGDGTGVHLDGLITQATAFDTTLYNPSTGYTRLDQLRRAKLQVRLAGLATFAPSGFVLHPADMARLELIKDANGLYIIGDPKTGPSVTLVWGLPVVESDSITAGTFLVGAFATAATLVDRMNAIIMISFEHDVNFTSNKATILCEERIGLAVKRPDAFVYGSFGSSPVGF